MYLRIPPKVLQSITWQSYRRITPIWKYLVILKSWHIHRVTTLYWILLCNTKILTILQENYAHFENLIFCNTLMIWCCFVILKYFVIPQLRSGEIGLHREIGNRKIQLYKIQKPTPRAQPQHQERRVAVSLVGFSRKNLHTYSKSQPIKSQRWKHLAI